MGETREEWRGEQRKGEGGAGGDGGRKSGSTEGKEEEEEEEQGYSSLVFHLITAKGPRAAVRHIFFNVFFSLFPPSSSLTPPPPFSITNIN